MIQLDWRRQDGELETAEAYAAATARHLAKARVLLADLRHAKPAEFLAAEARALDSLARDAARPGLGLDQQRATCTFACAA